MAEKENNSLRICVESKQYEHKKCPIWCSAT